MQDIFEHQLAVRSPQRHVANAHSISNDTALAKANLLWPRKLTVASERMCTLPSPGAHVPSATRVKNPL